MYSRPDLIPQTPVILGHHLQSLVAKDLEAVLSDYTDQSILFTPNGLFIGVDQLRGFFTQFIATLTPEVLVNFKLERQDVRGNYGYITWSSGSSVPFGTDTFLIRDSKIAMQSFATFMSG